MQENAFQILTDVGRRRVIDALVRGERQVNDIVAEAGIHQSGVSRHLRILNDAAFVAVRADGQKRLYSLKPERFRELDAWLARYRSLWEARPDRFDAALNAKPQHRNGKE